MKSAVTHTLLLSLLAMLLFCACDVHEFPEEPEPTPPEPPVLHECQLNLVHDRDDFDFLTNVTIGNGNTRSEADGTCDIRYTVRIYRYDERGTRVFSRAVSEYYTGTVPDDGSHPDLSIPLNLEAGEYDIVAWTDHVSSGSEDDLFFHTDDFMEIKFFGAGSPGYVHNGNEANRIAWRGIAHVIVGDNNEIALYEDPDNPVTRVDIAMERPMSRYHFITNDLNKFIENETLKLAVMSEEDPGPVPPTPEAPPSPDLSEYRIVMRYTGYMPISYNIFTDKPVDSSPGVSFEGRINAIDEHRAELAFDHVLVNHNNTSVQVALDLYRVSDGTRLSTTGVIDVPLQRGHYTTVEGPMLTTTAGAAMGINPSFNGDFNIEIH